MNLQFFGGRGASSSSGGFNYSITTGKGNTYKVQKKTKEFIEESKKQDIDVFILDDTRENILGERKSFYQKYQDGVANENNFFINTIGEFEQIKTRPRRQPDYVSRTRDGKVSSEYWYTEEGVIRGSNHWGANVASCDWFLGNQKTSMHGKKQYGKIKWSDFVQKTEVVYSNQFAKKANKGKAILSSFKNVSGSIKGGGGTSLLKVKGYTY